jgi:hypothetical protein
MTDGTQTDEARPGRAPKVGDIVIYRPREQERALRNNYAQEVAAIVTRAEGDTLNLRAFADGTESVWVTSVGRGNGVGQWRERG